MAISSLLLLRWPHLPRAAHANCLSKIFGHFGGGHFFQRETVMTYWTAQCIVLQKVVLLRFQSKKDAMEFCEIAPQLTGTGPGNHRKPLKKRKGITTFKAGLENLQLCITNPHF